MYLTALPRRASRPGAHMDGCFHPCVCSASCSPRETRVERLIYTFVSVVLARIQPHNSYVFTLMFSRILQVQC